MKQKKIPLRMCLGCHLMMPKKVLIRIVNGKEGGIGLDFTGKKPGRGAYICRSEICFDKVRKGRKIDKAFECHVEDSVYIELQKKLQQAGNQGV